MNNVLFSNVIMNDFSLDVKTHNSKNNKIDRHGFTYYLLDNNQKYQLILSNNNPTRCDAHVWLSGQKVGIFRINPWKKLTVSNKLFVFDKSNSYTSKWTSLDCNTNLTGLIKVIFKPEAGSCGYGCSQQYNNHCSIINPNSVEPKGEINVDQSKRCDDSWAAQYQNIFGSNNSTLQNNKQVSALKDIDHSRVTTMQARLISN